MKFLSLSQVKSEVKSPQHWDDVSCDSKDQVWNPLASNTTWLDLRDAHRCCSSLQEFTVSCPAKGSPQTSAWHQLTKVLLCLFAQTEFLPTTWQKSKRFCPKPYIFYCSILRRASISSPITVILAACEHRWWVVPALIQHIQPDLLGNWEHFFLNPVN